MLEINLLFFSYKKYFYNIILRFFILYKIDVIYSIDIEYTLLLITYNENKDNKIIKKCPHYEIENIIFRRYD